MTEQQRQLNNIHWIVWINLLLTLALFVAVLIR